MTYRYVIPTDHQRTVMAERGICVDTAITSRHAVFGMIDNSHSDDSVDVVVEGNGRQLRLKKVKPENTLPLSPHTFIEIQFMIGIRLGIVAYRCNSSDALLNTIFHATSHMHHVMYVQATPSVPSVPTVSRADRLSETVRSSMDGMSVTQCRHILAAEGIPLGYVFGFLMETPQTLSDQLARSLLKKACVVKTVRNLKAAHDAYLVSKDGPLSILNTHDHVVLPPHFVVNMHDTMFMSKYDAINAFVGGTPTQRVSTDAALAHHKKKIYRMVMSRLKTCVLVRPAARLDEVPNASSLPRRKKAVELPTFARPVTHQTSVARLRSPLWKQIVRSLPVEETTLVRQTIGTHLTSSSMAAYDAASNVVFEIESWLRTRTKNAIPQVGNPVLQKLAAEIVSEEAAIAAILLKTKIALADYAESSECASWPERLR